MLKAIVAAMSFALLTLGSQAQATSAPMAMFTFTANNGEISYSWQPLVNPVVADVYLGLSFNDVSIPGNPVTFYSLASGLGEGAGFGNQTDSFFAYDEKLLYSGDEFSPTFIFGTYAGKDIIDPDPEHFRSFNDAKLTIERVAAPVPEPESYVLLLAGLGVIGAVVKRRKPA
jgi:hypothetical protein